MKLFGGSASLQLAEKIGNTLHSACLKADQHIFPDGERRVRIADPVVDASVVIVQSACPPVDTNYMELFFLIDAVKRSGAEKVTVVIPYFGYQRQDHIFRDGEAVSLEVVIRILESLEIDRVVSVDMHSSRIPDLFVIPVTHVSAMPLFADTITKYGWATSDTLLISPDTGGIRRIKELANLLDLPYAVLEKERNLESGEIVITGLASGSFTGKQRAIIVDDMMASGETTVLAATFLKKQGIRDISAFATHAIFSANAPKILQKSAISHIFVTDTVAVAENKKFPKLTILSVAPLLAKTIQEEK